MPVLPRPKGHSEFRFDEHLVREILSCFGLEGQFHRVPILFEAPAPVKLGARTATAHKTFIDTQQGPLFLKLIPWYCDRQDWIEFRHSWIEAVASSGYTIPRPLHTREGRSWAEIGGRKYALTTCVHGSRWRSEPAQVLAAARHLAALHSVAPPRALCAPQEDYFQLVREHIALADRLLFEAGRSNAGTIAASFAAILDEAEARAVANGWRGLPRTGIHGDFSPWNVIFSGTVRDVGAAACDFDNADFGQRLHDIVEGMLTFGALNYSRESTNFRPSRVFEYRPDLTDFLESYCAEITVQEGEWACVPDVSAAFAIEVYCLGLMRKDFSPSQIPEMRQELERVRQGAQEVVGRVRHFRGHRRAFADARFPKARFDFWQHPPCKVRLLRAALAEESSRERIERECVELRRSGLRPILLVPPCSCSDHVGFGGARGNGGLRYEGDPLEVVCEPDELGVVRIDLEREITGVATVTAVLRRMHLTDDCVLVLPACTRCGANVDVYAALAVNA